MEMSPDMVSLLRSRNRRKHSLVRVEIELVGSVGSAIADVGLMIVAELLRECIGPMCKNLSP